MVNKADTQNGETALHCAANKGQAEVVKLLLERDNIDIDFNTNVSNYGITPLMQASSWNYHEVVRLFLQESGFDVNKADHRGITALSYASYGGHVESVQLLLDKDEIDVNIRRET